MLDRDEPLPLSRWMDGHVTILWKSGNSSTHRMCRQTVERMRMTIGGRQGPDCLQWYDDAFLQYEAESIDLVEWKAKPDFGWPLKPEERDSQERNGFRGGIIAALVDFWREEGGTEPSYSARALTLLHQGIAEDVNAESLPALARRLEGSDGASLVERAYAAVEPGATENSDPPVTSESQAGVADPEDAASEHGSDGLDLPTDED